MSNRRGESRGEPSETYIVGRVELLRQSREVGGEEDIVVLLYDRTAANQLPFPVLERQPRLTVMNSSLHSPSSACPSPPCFNPATKLEICLSVSSSLGAVPALTAARYSTMMDTRSKSILMALRWVVRDAITVVGGRWVENTWVRESEREQELGGGTHDSTALPRRPYRACWHDPPLPSRPLPSRSRKQSG